MTTYQQYQQQFASSLIRSIQATSGETSGKIVILQNKGGSFSPVYTRPYLPAVTLVENLVDALPDYENSDWYTTYRAALVNLLQVSLPNAAIGAQPQEIDVVHIFQYGYNGPFSGYRDAFFHGISSTAVTAQIASLVSAADSNLNSGWWGNFALALLTDAVRQVAAPPLDTNKLSADLSNYNAGLEPALSSSYLAFFQTGYSPTVDALNAIGDENQTQAACTVLTNAILDGQFTLDINNAMALGSPFSSTAVWFLYNLWMSLKVLGCPDVDSVIQQAKTAGLEVADVISAGTWWSNGIGVPALLTGADLVPTITGIAVADLPEKVFDDGQDDGTTTVSVGYAQSLCNWGSMNVYNPPPASCFGKGTGVLMADGSVKPIEQIQIGDQVQSHLGPRQVVLIETPKRGNRTLYQISPLNVFATEAHPFRSAAAAPLRLAVNPWAVMDGIPTMIAAGVGTLTTGSVLMGYEKGATQNITVNQLVTYPASSKTECVYDLLLENWTKDHPAYFVGGPDSFLAVDSETADPMYNLPGTAAVLTAMQMTLETCRQSLTDPNAQLPTLLTSLPLQDLRSLAYQAFPALTAASPKLPAIPDAAFYQQNGTWDAHASALEFHLVRQFSPRLRREARMGWRSINSASQQDHFTLCVHDIFLMGDISIPLNESIQIQFMLQGGDSADLVQSITLTSLTTPTWALFIDQVIDFGQLDSTTQAGTLVGTIQIGEQRWGQFRAAIAGTPQTASVDHFIFGSSGRIIGRISFEQRWVESADLIAETQRAQQWTDRQAVTMAISLGQQIGHKLNAQFQKSYSRSRQSAP
jgi:hypothetical protein